MYLWQRVGKENTENSKEKRWREVRVDGREEGLAEVKTYTGVDCAR